MDPIPDEEPVPLAALLARAGRAVAQARDRAATARGLSATALGALAELTRAGAASHRELAARLGVAPATLTPVADALEAAGDLTRSRDPQDRRVVRLAITPDGRARQARATAVVDDELRRRLPAPPPGHEEIIRAHLVAVLTALGEDR